MLRPVPATDWPGPAPAAAPVSPATRVRASRPSTSPTSRCRADARRSGGSPRCAGCAACSTATPATPDGKIVVEVDAAPEVSPSSTVDRADPLVGRCCCRSTGSRRSRWPASPRARWSSRPRRRCGLAPDRGRRCAARAPRRSRAVTSSSRSARRPRRPSSSTTAAARRYAGNVEVIVGDGAKLTVVSLQDWDARRGPRRARTRIRSAATRRCARSWSRSAATSCGSPRPSAFAGPGGDAELLGLYFADAGQHLEHRLFVDHASPALPQPGHLQGRAAGRGRAHGLDRRRR